MLLILDFLLYLYGLNTKYLWLTNIMRRILLSSTTIRKGKNFRCLSMAAMC